MSIIVLLIAFTLSSKAMGYEQARQQALFLTDKMAYELNLTDDQYEAAYEINLDYLMSVNTVDDLYGSYWRYRNLDLSYVLLDWQYRAFCDAAYFYRPLYFSAGCWHFGIYARYPYRDYFYFDRPRVFVSYRGGHSWTMNHGRSWYDGRHFGPRPGVAHVGMRDGFNRGDYGKGNRQTFGSRRPTGVPQERIGSQFGNRTNVPQNRNNTFGSRGSSTRTTVNQPSMGAPERGSSSFGSRRGQSSDSYNSTPRSTFTRPNATATQRPSNNTTSRPSFGSNRGSFSGGNNGSFGGGSRSSFGGGGTRSGSSQGSGSSKGGFGSRR